MPTAARLALLTACVLWAVSFIASKVALESTPALVVVALRLAVSAACFALWMTVAGLWRAVSSWRLLLALTGLSLLGTSLHFALQTIGLQWTTAANAALYAATAPLTIAFLAVVWLGERLTARKALGLAVAVVGVVTVMGWQEVLAFELSPNLLGDLLVMASIVMWGLFTVAGKRLTDRLGALAVTAWVTVIGAVTAAPVALVDAARRDFHLAAITPRSWAAIAFLGVLCSFLATLLYFVALERAESQQVGVYLYTIPPMTALIAFLALGERLDTGFFVGSALVLVGVRLTEA